LTRFMRFVGRRTKSRMKVFVGILCLVVVLEAAPRSVLMRHLVRTLGDFSTFQQAGDETGEAADDGDTIPLQHHNYQMTKEKMENITKQCPDITKMYSVGQSVEGRELYVMVISDSPNKHKPGNPEFKYVSTMHGNEVVGKELLLNLMQKFCDNYGKDEKMTGLVRSVRMHFMPCMNPDGYEKAYNDGGKDWLLGRSNANNKDLNRNFPDQYIKNKDNSEQEPETREVMDWICNEENPFVLSANLHGGSLVANYPYDDTKEQKTEYSASPDDDVFRSLATFYSDEHKTMHLKEPEWDCPDVPVDKFDHGITNGAKWYNVAGGMQDFNYLRCGCMELTLELGCDKFPKAHKLQKYWNDNKKALVSFIGQSKKGVKGFVRDAETKDTIEGAIITVEDRQHDVRSHSSGDYFRLLLPGTYTLTARKDNYNPIQKTVVIKPNSDAVELDFLMEKSENHQPDTGLQQLIQANTEQPDNSLLKQIQNIDQQLLTHSSQTDPNNEFGQFSPSVSIGGLSAHENTPKGADSEESMNEFLNNNSKEDDQIMNDFDLEKQDFFDQKTDLQTSDQA